MKSGESLNFFFPVSFFLSNCCLFACALRFDLKLFSFSWVWAMTSSHSPPFSEPRVARIPKMVLFSHGTKWWRGKACAKIPYGRQSARARWTSAPAAPSMDFFFHLVPWLTNDWSGGPRSSALGFFDEFAIVCRVVMLNWPNIGSIKAWESSRDSPALPSLIVAKMYDDSVISLCN